MSLRPHSAIALGVMLVSSMGAIAQDGTQPTRVPSLDELLGLEIESEAPDNTEIDQALSAQQTAEAFAQAVGLMGEVADRLQTNETGLATQRMQENIIRKLDQVIESAQQNQSSGSSGGSSSSSSSSQQQPDQRSQQQPSPSTGAGEPGDGSTPPGSNEVGSNNRNNAIARWGSLPERLRDALSQGLDEPYSELYRSLTERYYKALAEDEE